MIFEEVIKKIQDITEHGAQVVAELKALEDMAHGAEHLTQQMIHHHSSHSPFIMGLTVFILAVFVGYYVVWKVTPALHSPLMAVTNAISSVIIVGALLACGLPTGGVGKVLGFLAVILAAVNIFGGFIVTQRMLHMFMRKK